MASTLEASEGPLWLMVEDKPYKDSRVYHLGKSFSSSVVLGVSGYPFKMKDKLLHLSTMQKEMQCLVGLSGAWRQHILHLGMLLQPLSWAAQKTALLSRVQSKKEFYSRSLWQCKQPSCLAQRTQQTLILRYEWWGCRYVVFMTNHCGRTKMQALSVL